jgi:hypothetical protein
MKGLLQRFVPNRVKYLRGLWARTRPLHPRECPICGFTGPFLDCCTPPRIDARCPRCGSLERHRLFWLWYRGEKEKLPQPILHFAAEPVLAKRFKETYSDYTTADLFRPADRKLNIENIELADNSVGTVICNHILEHVDDRKALKEIHRILIPSGLLVASVPIVEGWAHTYEDGSILDPHLRELHFGQRDHVRFYGRDLRDRFAEAGFTVEEVTAEGADVIRYGLTRGEKVFLCAKAID